MLIQLLLGFSFAVVSLIGLVSCVHSPQSGFDSPTKTPPRLLSRPSRKNAPSRSGFFYDVRDGRIK